MIASTHTGQWLSIQCRLIDAAARGVVFVGEADSGSYDRAAAWPDDYAGSPLMASAAQTAVSRRQIVFVTPDSAAAQGAPRGEIAAAPIFVDGKVHGAVAIELPPAVNGQHQAVAQLLQIGSAWFRQVAAAEDSPRARQQGLVIELMAAALAPPRFHAAATAVATELATRLGCERVALGFLKERQVKLEALSHSASFSRHQQLIRQVEAAMEEALERETTVLHPDPAADTPGVYLSHAQFARQQQSTAVLTIPLHRDKTMLGALTFERGPAQPPFDVATVTLCEQIAALLGPILELRRQQDRPLRAVIREALHAQLARLFGPGNLVLKLSTMAALSFIAVAALVPGQYQVAADALLEGRVERVVAAPQKGFIQSVSARPGDVVAETGVLAALDDRDLRLEQLKWSAKQEQVSREFRKALAERDRPSIGILRAQLDQAEAQLALVEKQLARLQLTAPFAGVVVSGDFTQALGSPVERGQVLFKIAPLEGYRVILKVDEGDIADVQEGQRGRLTLTAAPGEPLPLVVERITPVASTDANANYFRVEAKLDAAPDFLRPGMQGVAKIDIDSRQLIWIWTRSLTNWIRLKLWSLLP